MAKEDRIKFNLAVLENALERFSYEELIPLERLIPDAERIFVEGKGRSGLVMRMFAMRLMQMGLTTYVVGETTTPAIQPGDVLVVGSASGETEGSVLTAKKASDVGAKIIALTTSGSSTLHQLADHALILPGESPKVTSELKSGLVLGTLFEQCLLIVLDSLVAQLVDDLQQDTSTMMTRHGNLE